jgi:hypothetical protein
MEMSGQLHAPAVLHPGRVPPEPSRQEAGSATESVWTLWKREKDSLPCQESNLVSLVTQLHRLRYPEKYNH